MFKNINWQFVISYLGLLPFLIIFVFIGAVNWNLRQKISTYYIFLGFFPSLSAVFLIIMFLFSFEVIPYIIIFLIFQLLLDNFNYKEKKDKFIYYQLRIPLTFFIVVILISILL